MTNITRLPGTPVVPEVLIAQLNDKSGDYDGVWVVVKKKDGVFEAYSSLAKASDWALAVRVLDREFVEAFYGPKG